jgi:hypothetical protein
VFQLKVAGGAGLRDLAADLRRAGAGHRERVAQSLREPTKDIHDRVRAAVKAPRAFRGYRVPGARRRVPSGLGRGNHLRAPLLRGLTWKVTTSAADPRAEIVWNPNRIDPRVRPVFAYVVRQKKFMRHPIFGKTDDGGWRGGAAQDTPDAWKPARKLGDAAQRSVAKAVDETAAIINGRR